MSRIQAIEIAVEDLRFPALSCGQGPLVLLQHGFPDLPESFRAQLTALAAAGYRAVAPTLRGYHRRCLPPLREVSAQRAADDLAAMVTALGEERAALVGHDWGAVATYLAVSLYPDRFRCGVASAIPWLGGLPGALARVPRQLVRSAYQLYFALPWLPERSWKTGAEEVVAWCYRRWSPGFEPPPELHDAVVDRLADARVQAASLQYYRALLRPGPDQREVLRTLREAPSVPVLTTYGERDGCMDARLYPLAAGHGQALACFEDAGHFVHLEAPAAFDACVLGWLRQHHPIEEGAA